ncbi:MAG: hypothetical protein ABIP36_00720 [Acidimicrobiales bacterium]
MALSASEDDPTRTRAAEERPGVCVLLIEGRADTASVVRTLLGASAAARFDVLRTATIEAGIDALALRGIDVVVLGTGSTCDDPSTSELLRATAELPVIALTGSDDPQVAVDLIDAGFHDCVPAARISADALGWSILRAVHRARGERGVADAPRATGRPPGDRVAHGGSAPGPAPSMATDARTPVTALIGLVDLLTSSWETLGDDQRRTTLSRIGVYAASVERLTVDLLTIASLHADVAQPRPRQVTLAAAIHDAVVADATGTTVQVDPEVTVWVDPTHLGQILKALLAHVGLRVPSPLLITTTGQDRSSVRISIGSSVDLPSSAIGWSLLQDLRGGPPDEGVALAVARTLAEANGGVAGQDDSTGTVWVRLPGSSPEPLTS